MGRLDLAEDVVQDTLCRALESWPIQGVPENPSGWLMRVARNRAVDVVRRDKHFRDFAPELTQFLASREDTSEEILSFEKEIQDDQLRMMFSCCHPDLSTEVQVTLILKTLCGFSVFEIAHALLISHDSVEKRLTRARKLLRDVGTLLELNDANEIPQRLEAVYQAIYLLFNEGYHGTQPKRTIREELCFEAMRLALLLPEHPEGNKPRTDALLALFCFHAARLASRIDEGGLIQLQLQDRSKWDHDLIGQGFRYLQNASSGAQLSEYHLEAAIASLHCAATTYEDTDWRRILDLYNLLYELKPTPIVALNRAIAAGNALGAREGLNELEKIPDSEKLKDYPFYPAAFGEFYLMRGDLQKAENHFQRARKLARSKTEASFFKRKIKACHGE